VREEKKNKDQVNNGIFTTPRFSSHVTSKFRYISGMAEKYNSVIVSKYITSAKGSPETTTTVNTDTSYSMKI
jgi:hypothetical protein